jgi:hypothetical protein
VYCGKEKLTSHMAFCETKEGDHLSIRKFDEWYARAYGAQLTTKYTRQKLTLTLFYHGLAIRNYVSLEFVSDESVEQAEKVLTDWRSSLPGKQFYANVRADVVELVDEIDLTQEAEEDAVEEELTKQRSTVTNQRRLIADADLQDAKVNGNNWGLQIFEKWTCKNPNCFNHTNTFYYNDSTGDNFNHHFPVYSDSVTAWCKEIMEGKSTLEKPGVTVLLRLVSGRTFGSTASQYRKSKKKLTPPPPPVSTTSYAPNIIIHNGPHGTPAPATPAPDPPSSPVRSSDTDPSEKMEAFWMYAAGSKTFGRGDIPLLTAAAEKVSAEGWDLRGLQKDCTDADWQAMGLPIGLFRRLKRDIKGFMRKC